MDYRERESQLLAPYATRAGESAGRRHAEPEHPYRSPFQRDRDRVTHSAAFRRLSQKTQVFTGELLEATEPIDYHRTRLTHTLEVASIARTVARALRLNEDLVEALALGHDVGHPPFGHAGEEILGEFLRGEGGFSGETSFDHNAQALRIFERLEQRYPDRPGLNLSREVLDGQRSRVDDGETPASLEAQVVDATDSIAYGAHDADDALEMRLLDLAELDEARLWRESVVRVRERYAALGEEQLRRATVHDLIERQVSELITSTTRAIASSGVSTALEASDAGILVSCCSETTAQQAELSAFLFERVYRHEVVLRHRADAAAALEQTLRGWMSTPERLPPLMRQIAEEESLGRAVVDFVSSLTDRAVLGGRGRRS